jgi:hypothetical protein
MVSVAVPLACLTSVRAVVRMVPVARAGAGPDTPVGQRPGATAAAAAVAAVMPAEPASRRRWGARPLVVTAAGGGRWGVASSDRESRSSRLRALSAGC